VQRIEAPRGAAKGRRRREAPSSLRSEVLAERQNDKDRREDAVLEPRIGLAFSLAENLNSRLTSNVENLQFLGFYASDFLG
jgi:hypothetical protein